MILIDPRRGSGELAPFFKNKGVPFQLVDEMPASDFCFEGNGPDGRFLIGVERKTVKDMLTSIRSGRFSGHQLIELQQMCKRVYVIIEGIYGPAPDGLLCEPHRSGGKTEWYYVTLGTQRFMYSFLENAQTSISEVCRGWLWFRRSSNKEETAHMVVNLYNEWNKPYDRERVTDASVDTHVEILTKWSVTRRVAKELDGIGTSSSRAVEQHFGSVEEMVKATEAEWSEVELPRGKGKRRLGKVGAEKIYRELRGGK